MQSTGFIGLGIMGKPMSKNLLKAGYPLVVYDANRTAIAEVCTMGAVAASSAAEVAAQCKVIITMLPNSPHVREVVLGKNGIAESASRGTLIIDMSSIDPVESRAIGAELEKKGIDFMDAPVSGGEPKAIDGTLSVMVGGKQELFEQQLPMLKKMAASVVLVGELGAGNIAKLANQMVVAANIAILSEALVFAKKAKADPEKVYKAIRGGLAGSTVMDAKAPLMLEGKFDPGFRVELHVKDLNNALSAAHNVNSPAPITAQAMEILQYLMAGGYATEDHSSMVRFYEALSGITLDENQT